MVSAVADANETPPGVVLTPEQKAKQRRRSIALALAIAGLVVLFYVITIVKMGPAIFQRPM